MVPRREAAGKDAADVQRHQALLRPRPQEEPRSGHPQGPRAKAPEHGDAEVGEAGGGASASLQPQTPVTITIDNVTKKSDGTILVTLKAFTSQATSYSALDPASFIQYVSLDSDNQSPTNASAIFNSMPPKSVNTGTVTFHVDPSKADIILQTGQGDNPNFYDINFTTETYKETTVG